MAPAESVSPGSQRLVDLALADLAQRLSIDTDRIEVVEAKAVIWPDGGLGCPQPGVAYAQVLTSGYLIVLEANHKEYEYHASSGTEVIYCENPMPPVSGTPVDQ